MVLALDFGPRCTNSGVGFTSRSYYKKKKIADFPRGTAATLPNSKSSP